MASNFVRVLPMFGLVLIFLVVGSSAMQFSVVPAHFGNNTDDLTMKCDPRPEKNAILIEIRRDGDMVLRKNWKVGNSFLTEPLNLRIIKPDPIYAGSYSCHVVFINERQNVVQQILHQEVTYDD